jgi:hypothetical protein
VPQAAEWVASTPSDTIADMDLPVENVLELSLDEPDALSPEEQADLEDATPVVSPVAYSGQDFDVEGLVRRLRKGDMKIPQFGHDDPDIDSAGFQRSFVWNRSQMDRFIESMLLGYPIPGIFLVRQTDNRYLVLDGQQRLKTLEYFYKGIYQGRHFALRNVATNFQGLTYETLPDDLRRMLDNAFIQATIVDTDGSARSLSAVYQIFERLNSGGTQLTAHEIRVALYAGTLIDYVEQLNTNVSWRGLYGNKNQRIRDQELVIRIIALFLELEDYARPQKSFLNNFVAENRNGPSSRVRAAGDLFIRACEVFLAGPGPQALRRAARQVNYAQTDAIFVGLMKRLEQSNITPEQCSLRLEELRADDAFREYIVGPTADEDMVKGRVRIAIEAFAD